MEDLRYSRLLHALIELHRAPGSPQQFAGPHGELRRCADRPRDIHHGHATAQLDADVRWRHRRHCWYGQWQLDERACRRGRLHPALTGQLPHSVTPCASTVALYRCRVSVFSLVIVSIQVTWTRSLPLRARFEMT